MSTMIMSEIQEYIKKIFQIKRSYFLIIGIILLIGSIWIDYDHHSIIKIDSFNEGVIEGNKTGTAYGFVDGRLDVISKLMTVSSQCANNTMTLVSTNKTLLITCNNNQSLAWYIAPRKAVK